MSKGLGPFSLFLIGLMGSLIISGIAFLALYNRVITTKRAMVEANILEGINKFRLAEISLTEAIEYSFNEASFLASKRGGYLTLEYTDSLNCIPYWRQYEVIDYPGFSQLEALTLRVLNNYEYNFDDISTPIFTKLEIEKLSDSFVNIKIKSNNPVKLSREKFEISSGYFEKNINSNILNLYSTAKQKFLDSDPIKDAIQVAINSMPPDCLTIQLYDICESEIEQRTEINSVCPGWENTLKEKIKEEIENLRENGDIETRIYLSDQDISFDIEKDLEVEYDSGYCGCKNFISGVCTEYYRIVKQLVSKNNFYASAKVQVIITDNTKEYKVLDDDNSMKTEKIRLKFHILSGNDYDHKIQAITDDELCEITVIKERSPSEPGAWNPSFGDIKSCPSKRISNYIDDYNKYRNTIYSAIDSEGFSDLIGGRDRGARLVAAIITQESGWNQNTACSETSGCGIMQITKSTASGCEGGWDAIKTDANANIRCGVKVFGNKLNSMRLVNGYDSENLIKLTLAAYNGGQATINEAIEIAGDSKWESINKIDIMTEACKRMCKKYNVYCGIESWKAGIIIKYVDDTVYPYYQDWLQCESERNVEVIEYPVNPRKYDHTRWNFKIDRLVYHYTVGDLSSTLYTLGDDPNRKASVHYVIDRDGKIYKLVDEKYNAWHAGCAYGTPQYCVDKNINPRSIGIEIVNSGYTCDNQKRTDCVYLTENPRPSICPQNLITDYWEEYDEAQINSLIKLSADIIRRNPEISVDRDHILGHDELICQKHDPGPAFPWDRVIQGIKDELSS
ncbi:MAG: N-acetylmuramoyl-L-alanine amidase [Candidatus Aenigmatarchaeota archaeon]